MAPRVGKPAVGAAAPLPVHCAVDVPLLAEDRVLWQRIPVAPAPLPPVHPGCPRPPPISFWAATEEAILCAGTNADLQEC
eukprot:9058026-Pyramimonas_sp.AAC.1